MKIDKNQIYECLREVADPLTGKDLVSAGRVGEVKISKDNLSCSLVYPQALEPAQKSSLNFACIQAIQNSFPKLQVHVHLETQLATGSPPSSILPQVKNIVAVASGKGGVGKSTVSTNLALGLKAKGHKVGLLDADLYGPSIPTMLGLSGQRPKLQDVHGKPKIIPLQAHGIPVMSIGFIVEPEQAVVLRGPRLAGIIKQFIAECIWPDLDYLVVDLPPGTGDIQLTLVQTVPLTGVLLITTPQQVAVDDALKAMNMFRLESVKVPLLGVIENMAWFTPAELPENRYYLFGQGGGERLAAAGDTQLVGQVPIVQDVMEGGEKGVPSLLSSSNESLKEIWLDLADKVHHLVDERNKTLAPTRIVGINT